MRVPPAVADYWTKSPDKPVSPDDIDRLEAAFGRLPRAYRDFLETIGPKPFHINGWSELTAAYDVDTGRETRSFSLGWLYGPDLIVQIQKALSEPMDEEVGPRIPPGMLIFGDAIARTSGFVMFDLSPRTHGSVWTWERIDETWGTSDNDLLGFVAPDFETMIASIRPAT